MTMTPESGSSPPSALLPSDHLVGSSTSSSAKHAPSEPTRSRVSSEVSLATARVYWLGVVSAHIATALFYYDYAAVYSHIPTSPSEDVVVSYVQETSILAFYTPVMIFSSVIAIGHTIAVVNALLSSYRSRELVFSPDIWLDGPDKKAALATVQLQNRDKWHVLKLLFAAYYKIKKRGLYLVQVCAVVEAALQIFQGNKLSHLVASMGINRLMVAAIVLTCWYIPLVHFGFRKRREKHHNPAIEVLMQHVVASCLEVVYGMVTPMMLLHLYYRDLNVDNGTVFPTIFYYRDTWFTNAVAENTQVFVSSWADFVAKMMPGLALLYQLHEMQLLLQVSPRAVSSLQRQVCIKSPAARSMAATATVEPTVGASASTTAQSHEVKRLPPRGKIRHFLDVALFCTGVVVLALHVHAESVASNGRDDGGGCLLELQPWGSKTYACAVLEVNCLKSTTTNSDGKYDVDAALTGTDAHALNVLILSHSLALSMPPSIQQFSELTTLKLHHVTLTSWGDDTALTETSHPKLARIYISLTNMSELPVSLRCRDFPSHVRDIQLCATNLTALPTDLHEEWGHAVPATFRLEQSPGIVHLPETLTKLQVQHLSLVGNGIHAIPDEALRD